MRGPLGMAVNAGGNVVFLDEVLDQVDLLRGRLDGDGANAKFFGKLEYLPRSRLIFGDSHDTEIHDEQAVLLRLGLEFFNRFVRGVWIDLGFLVVRAERLARIKLNRFAARRRSSLNRLKRGEAVEGVSLAAEHKSSDAILRANGRCSIRVNNGHCRGERQGTFPERESFHSL